jgi:predicted transcriptional regulator of viral defense system
MRLLDALSVFEKLGTPVFSTNDAAAILNISRASASQLLLRLAKGNHLMKLKRGLWGLSNLLEPLLVPDYLTSPFPSYVSLQSALYYHGMISQIPEVLYAVSLGRTRYYHTPLVDVSIHHIDIGFFGDYLTDEKSGIRMATPEKALLDVFYLSDTQTKLFSSLPEIELPKRFNRNRALSLINSIRSPKKRTRALRCFEAFSKLLNK